MYASIVANAAGADATGQCLRRGLVDEILVYVLPVLLGDGIRLRPACADLLRVRKKQDLKKVKIFFLKVECLPARTSYMTEQTMDWQELTNLTRGQPFVVERVRLAGSGVAIEGEFELPQLAQLNVEDQVFVTAFVRCHGSIKEMERIFGVSYPTIKSRLNRITQMLDFVETNPAPSRADIIDRLRRGEITAQQALSELEDRT
jgi:hypothetical protein